MTTLQVWIAYWTIAAGGVDQTEPQTFDVRGCGPLALRVIAELNVEPITAEIVDRVLPSMEPSCSLQEVAEAAQKLGLHTVALGWPHGLADDLAVPAILPITMADGRRHFVVLVRSEGEQVQIIDYPDDPVWVPASSLASADWNGVALHISSDPAAIAELRRMAEGDWRRTAGWIGGAVLLALVIGVVERTWLKRRDHVPA